MYSELLLDHFEHPRCVGPLADCGAHARERNPVCGDVLEFYLKAEEQELSVAFRAEGCVPVLAVGSLVADWADGRSLQEARQMDAKFLSAMVGPLPSSKKHAISLAVRTFKRALSELNDVQK